MLPSMQAIFIFLPLLNGGGSSVVLWCIFFGMHCNVWHTFGKKFLMIEASMAARADPISWFTTVFTIRLAGWQSDTLTTPIAALPHYHCLSQQQYLHRNLTKWKTILKLSCMKWKTILKLSLPVTFFVVTLFTRFTSFLSSFWRFDNLLGLMQQLRFFHIVCWVRPQSSWRIFVFSVPNMKVHMPIIKARSNAFSFIQL